MTHRHSRLALATSAEQLSLRAREIMDIMIRCHAVGPMTDRQIKDTLDLDDMNSVRPRITELIQAGWLRECGETRCPVTGKTVRVVEAVRERQCELL